LYGPLEVNLGDVLLNKRDKAFNKEKATLNNNKTQQYKPNKNERGKQ